MLGKCRREKIREMDWSSGKTAFSAWTSLCRIQFIRLAARVSVHLSLNFHNMIKPSQMMALSVMFKANTQDVSSTRCHDWI